MGLHRKSFDKKKIYYLLKYHLYLTFFKRKIQGCSSIEYFKYDENKRTMKEKINHYGYSNLLIGRYAWYFFSIVTIKNSNLKFLKK